MRPAEAFYRFRKISYAFTASLLFWLASIWIRLCSACQTWLFSLTSHREHLVDQKYLQIYGVHSQ
jgi:hypothetical protein